MNDGEAAAIETSWARLRLREVLEDEGFVCVVDRVDAGGNWRAEFHREGDAEEEACAAWALKPGPAPYVSLGVIVALPTAETLADYEARATLAAEHDLAFTTRSDGTLAQLSTRIPISSLDAEGIALHLRNLAVAQAGLVDLVEADARGEAARSVEIVDEVERLPDIEREDSA